MSEPKIHNARYCPKCNADWQGAEIPAEHRDKYYGGKTHFSRLIGIETRDYDGVSFWKCPDCGVEWNRFTGECVEAHP